MWVSFDTLSITPTLAIHVYRHIFAHRSSCLLVHLQVSTKLIPRYLGKYLQILALKINCQKQGQLQNDLPIWQNSHSNVCKVTFCNLSSNLGKGTFFLFSVEETIPSQMVSFAPLYAHWKKVWNVPFLFLRFF